MWGPGLDSLASALAAALLPDGDSRRRGEETLRVAAAEPGFCAKLLALTDVRSQLPDGVRLLATINGHDSLSLHDRGLKTMIHWRLFSAVNGYAGGDLSGSHRWSSSTFSRPR